jgi:hypothetical protein
VGICLTRYGGSNPGLKLRSPAPPWEPGSFTTRNMSSYVALAVIVPTGSGTSRLGWTVRGLRSFLQLHSVSGTRSGMALAPQATHRRVRRERHSYSSSVADPRS